MLRGLATVSYWADDLAAARTGTPSSWASSPTSSQGDAYFEFRIGDYQHELGLIDRRYQPHGAPPARRRRRLLARRRRAGRRRPAAGAGRQPPRGPPGPGRGLRDRLGDRPVRQHPGRHVQPALPGHPERGSGAGARWANARPPSSTPSTRCRGRAGRSALGRRREGDGDRGRRRPGGRRRGWWSRWAGLRRRRPRDPSPLRPAPGRGILTFLVVHGSEAGPDHDTAGTVAEAGGQALDPALSGGDPSVRRCLLSRCGCGPSRPRSRAPGRPGPGRAVHRAAAAEGNGGPGALDRAGPRR